MNEQNKVKVEGEGEGKIEELKARGAKLKACNDRSYARMAEINRIASETLVKTTHAGYEPGQYGQDYVAFGKAIGEIRTICKKDMSGDFPDYAWMAGMMTSEHFDPNRLARELEALASEKPIDYPTFYTPGWLVELAKKIEAGEKVKVGGEGEQRNETSAVHLDPSPSPAVLGCPSLGPKVFPSGADGTEPADGVYRTPEKIAEFCQSEMQREEARRLRKIVWRTYASKVDLAVMGKTRQNGKVYEVRVAKRQADVSDTYAQLKVNGKTVLTGSFIGSAWMAKRMMTAAAQALVNHKAKRNRDSRRNFKKRDAAKRAEAQALIDKELA